MSLIVVEARNAEGPGSNPVGSYCVGFWYHRILLYTGMRHSAEGGEMLPCGCGNYLGFLFQVDTSWQVNSVQGLSCQQDQLKNLRTQRVHLIVLQIFVQISCFHLGDNGVDANAGKGIR
eukprot:scaffold66308_cov40-Attheya_sp.AAC.1